jgi:hypothetical protein
MSLLYCITYADVNKTETARNHKGGLELTKVVTKERLLQTQKVKGKVQSLERREWNNLTLYRGGKETVRTSDTGQGKKNSVQ